MDEAKTPLRRLLGFTLAFSMVSLMFFILKWAQGFFVPLLLAFVIAYFIISVAEGFARLRFRGRSLPRSLTFISAFLALGVCLLLIASLISSTVQALLASAPHYQAKFAQLAERLLAALQLEVPTVEATFDTMLKSVDFRRLTTVLVQVLTDVASSAGLITVYVLFILLEYSFVGAKMDALLPSAAARKTAHQVIGKVTEQVQSYVRLKTIISAATALLSYAVLRGVGVDFADFWAFLIFFLNFIPTVGSIVATVFPCLLTLLQFDSLAPFAVVTASLTAIQFALGNVLEPRVMGHAFNLSGLVIILSLVVWGTIWGILGMFLSVPIMVIASIVLANFKQTRPIAIILSRDGKIS